MLKCSSASARNLSASWPSGVITAVMVGDTCAAFLLRFSRPHALTARRVASAEAMMAREHVVEAFLVQHVDAYVEAVQHLRRRRVGEEADLVHVEHVVPGEERLRQLRRLVRLERLVADRVERHAGRQHQALLRAADRDVDAPLVMAVVGRGERRDGVDHQQRRMAGRVDRLADLGDRRQRAGRGLVVQDADRLDLLVLVFLELGLDRLGIDDRGASRWR